MRACNTVLVLPPNEMEKILKNEESDSILFTILNILYFIVGSYNEQILV
jgi:hypothetical protein